MSVFRFRDREVIIEECGLDAYFFLRYLQTLLLKIFIPLACVILPILLPLNKIGGRGPQYGLESSGNVNVSGLDQYAWGNVRPTHTHRYWAHLILAIVVIIWVCGVISKELRVYVEIRQACLTSAEHRVQASARTVLVSAVPDDWQTVEALRKLYDIFPGGTQRIRVNRRLDTLRDKVRLRDAVFAKLEAAETELVRKASEAERRQGAKLVAPMKVEERPAWANTRSLARIKDTTAHHPVDDSSTAPRQGIVTINEERPASVEGESGQFGVCGTGAELKRRRHHNDRRTLQGDGCGSETSRSRDWWAFWKPLPVTPPLVGLGDSYDSHEPSGKGDTKGQHAELGGGSLQSSGSGSKAIGPSSRKAKIPLPVHPPAQEVAGAAWEKYLQRKDRPTHRPAMFSWTAGWLPGLPILTQKVDTIDWCRDELLRLNREIEVDQQHPERFPLMNSAFIQFSHQFAAHLASHTVVHHLPRRMVPRAVAIEPSDVIWNNMSISWLESWFRLGTVIPLVVATVILPAFPIAWTASLAQITSLIDRYSWLHWLRQIPPNGLQAISGVLPATVLGLLLAGVPPLLACLAYLSGVQTEVEKERRVQNFYFAFLFVQVFLVVSISGGAFAALTRSTDIATIPDTLAIELPKAANYFFSYMILQGMSASSGALLRPITLISLFVSRKANTARKKWRRDTHVPTVSWGPVFPIYTNFACIALIYSIVAPFIIVFAIISFALSWIANRYNILYVSRSQVETGGMLYPTAINQTFTGVYVMELLLIGLFFLVRDSTGQAACVAQAIVMLVAMLLTALYQILLNMTLAPLFHHLPLAIESDAVLRAQVFGRDRRYVNEQSAEESEVQSGGFLLPDKPSTQAHQAPTLPSREVPPRDIEVRAEVDNPVKVRLGCFTPEEKESSGTSALELHAIEAGRRILWIPQDNTGVSNDEVRKTREISKGSIEITNVRAALDGNFKPTYSGKPPDFSEPA